jgi:hypothetical protein|tara:strand:- start:285 stop:554 length:270 start_codon:yes stop_codon:yes gene_type:complete
MNEQVKTDITKRSYDNEWVLWAKLSAVRLGLEDKEQVKLGNKRDYLTWIAIRTSKVKDKVLYLEDLDRLGKYAQVYTVNTKQYKDATSK